MKKVITAIAVAAFTLGAASAYAGAGCNSNKQACADGYTYDHGKGGCVKIATSS